jgi:hypothetical protein
VERPDPRRFSDDTRSNLSPGLPDSCGSITLLSMSDRLRELRRQRALVQEQLAWLDQEIAKASSEEKSFPSSVPPVVSVPVQTQAMASADAIIDEYRVAPEVVKSDVRKGCLLYFALGLGLIVAGVIGLYLALRH